jgi:hypothetical protein
MVSAFWYGESIIGCFFADFYQAADRDIIFFTTAAQVDYGRGDDRWVSRDTRAPCVFDGASFIYVTVLSALSE